MKHLKLYENIDDITELFKLCDDILNYVFPKLKQYYIESINTAQRNKKIKIFAKDTIIYLKNILNDNYIIDNYNKLVPFIHSDIRIYFSIKMGDNYGGSYHKEENVVIINLNDPNLNNEIYRYVNNYNFKINEQRMNNILSKFKLNLKGFLSHELQHGYDNFRSNGNFDNNTKAKLYLSKWDAKKQNFNQYKGGIDNLYLKLPHEIWARFTEYISNTNISNISFYQFVIDFKKNYPGYNIINNKTKKRLLKELYKYYYQNQK